MRFIVIAVAGYLTGLTIGTAVCHLAWVRNSGETYRIGTGI